MKCHLNYVSSHNPQYFNLLGSQFSYYNIVCMYKNCTIINDNVTSAQNIPTCQYGEEYYKEKWMYTTTLYYQK